MAYADFQYYQEVYKGTVIPVEAQDAQLERASDQVDSMTYNRIVAIGFDNLTPFQQERIKKAVCAQAEFNVQYGDYVDVPLKGFSAGGISMSFAGEQINGIPTSRPAKGYLDQTGLTNRRIW